jgi:hypothetical protein
MTEKKITIQVYSDIHIEVWNKIPELPITAKYLFLAGDICQIYHPLFYPFLDYCSKQWEKVFYVPGNHEYYCKKNNFNGLEFEYKYKIKEKYKNVFYLNNEVVELNDDINVYGTTFWTLPPFSSTKEAKKYINDYHNISYFNQERQYTVDLDIGYVIKMSNESFNMIHDYLNGEKKKTIIITHFPPITTGAEQVKPIYLKEDIIVKQYFSWPDDTIKQFKLDNVLCWISGHTHWSYDLVYNDIRLIGNQIGYKSELGITNLNESGLYELSYTD